MASGSFKSNIVTAAGSGYYRQIEVVWSSTNNTASNNSIVSWTAYSRCPDSTNTARYVNAWNIYVTIDGTRQQAGSGTIQLKKDIVIGSGSVTVSHNADGRKTGVAVSLSGSIWDSSKTNCTYSGTIDLSPNPVYTLTISQGSNTTITVNRTSCAVSGSTGTMTAGSNKLYYGDVLKITAAASSSNYKLKTLTVNGSSFTSGSSHTVAGHTTVASTAEALASTVSATNATIGATSTITVTRNNTSYYHSLKYTFGNESKWITSSGGVSNSEVRFQATSIPFTVPDSFYAQIPNDKTGTCTITCKTYTASSGGSQVGDSKTCTFTASVNASVCAPTVSGTVTDTRSETVALTGNNSTLVLGESTARCSITTSVRKSATVASVTIDGTDVMSGYYKTYTNVTNSSFQFAVSDSRGYSANTTVSPTIIPYVALTNDAVVARTGIVSGTTTTSATLRLSGKYFSGSFGSTSNSLTVKYKYKPSSGSYGSETTVTGISINSSSNSYSKAAVDLNLSLDYNQSYVFQVTASDALYTITKTITVQKTTPVFDWGESDMSINVPTKIDGNLTMNGQILFDNRQQTAHRYIYFGNDSSSTNHHDIAVYGGNPGSVNAFGIWDITKGSPYYWPFLYRDANKQIMLDVSSTDYSKGYLADFPIEVKKDTTTGLYYKKWHSGLGEVFGRVKILGSEITESVESGGSHYSNTVYVDLPLTFKYVSGSPNDDICIIVSGGSYLTWAANISLSGSGSKISFRLLRTVALSSSIDYSMYIHVQGPLAGSSAGSTIYADRVFV